MKQTKHERINGILDATRSYSIEIRTTEMNIAIKYYHGERGVCPHLRLHIQNNNKTNPTICKDMISKLRAYWPYEAGQTENYGKTWRAPEARGLAHVEKAAQLLLESSIPFLKCDRIVLHIISGSDTLDYKGAIKEWRPQNHEEHTFPMRVALRTLLFLARVETTDDAISEQKDGSPELAS